jgi:hypothetical protein
MISQKFAFFGQKETVDSGGDQKQDFFTPYAL